MFVALARENKCLTMASKRLICAAMMLRNWSVASEFYIPSLISNSGSTPVATSRRVDYDLYNNKYHDVRGTKCSGCKYVPSILRYYPDAQVMLDAGTGNCKVVQRAKPSTALIQFAGLLSIWCRSLPSWH
jgi:hypothetical protein